MIASTLFRKQLLNPAMNNQQNQQMLQRSTSIDTQHVQVVSKEPRVCMFSIRTNPLARSPGQIKLDSNK